MTVYDGLGLRLRELRKGAGLSQAELAGKIGVSQAAIAHIESGRMPARAPTLDAFAAACGYRADIILTPIGEAPSEPVAPDEARLLATFRALPPRVRLTLLSLADTLAESMGGGS